ncbi:MAG: DUF547 domain-containing protein [Chthoniobacterales bacterium]
MSAYLHRVCLPALSLFLLATLCSPLALAKPQPKSVEIPSGIHHSAWDTLLQRYVNNRGLVAYGKWKANQTDRKALDDYLGQFAHKSVTPAKGDERTASAINAYNAFAIRWILENFPTDSIQDLPDSFTRKSHMIGGEKVSLDDIEHGTVEKQIGWRAHAVLVCCARSCPPLQRFAYAADKLDSQIDTAYRAWLSRTDLNKFEPNDKKVEISSIFKWYADDFKKAGGVKKVLARYAPEQYQSFLKTGDYDVNYLPYHWGLNDQGGKGKDYSKLDLYWDKITGAFKSN